MTYSRCLVATVLVACLVAGNNAVAEMMKQSHSGAQQSHSNQNPAKSDETGDAKKESVPKLGPLWVCETPTMEVDPVWWGEVVRFDFTVHNNGDEDLTFNIRPG